MHKEYATMCKIVYPTQANRFVVRWVRGGVHFDYALPLERMQIVYSGLMDVLRKSELEEPNTIDPDFCRGAALAENVIMFSRLHGIELNHRDFKIFAKRGNAYVPCVVRSWGFVRYGRPNNDGEHRKGGFFVSSKKS